MFVVSFIITSHNYKLPYAFLLYLVWVWYISYLYVTKQIYRWCCWIYCLLMVRKIGGYSDPLQ